MCKRVRQASEEGKGGGKTFMGKMVGGANVQIPAGDPAVAMTMETQPHMCGGGDRGGRTWRE